MKPVYRKINLEHSEDFPEGKTVTMNMGSIDDDKWGDIKVLVFEVQFEEDWGWVVVRSANTINKYPGGVKSLNRNEKHLCIERLFEKDIEWEV